MPMLAPAFGRTPNWATSGSSPSRQGGPCAARTHDGFSVSWSNAAVTNSCSSRAAAIAERYPGATTSSASTNTSFSARAWRAPTFDAWPPPRCSVASTTIKSRRSPKALDDLP